MTTRAKTDYTAFDYHPNDILLFGRESAGVPDEVHAAADARLTIPMQRGLRSLNIAISAAMAMQSSILTACRSKCQKE